MNKSALQDQYIGQSLAKHGTRVALIHWNGRNYSLMPLTQSERLDVWHKRFDALVGVETEEAHVLHARGAAAKRRMLMQIRNRDAQRQVKPAVRQIEILERHTHEEPRRRLIEVAPLRSLEKAAPRPVMGRRQKLSLAR